MSEFKKFLIASVAWVVAMAVGLVIHSFNHVENAKPAQEKAMSEPADQLLDLGVVSTSGVAN